MALLIFVAISFGASIWLWWEFISNGFYSGGFFNYRIVWGLLVWTFLGFCALSWLQISN
jgi:hypothetical protein